MARTQCSQINKYFFKQAVELTAWIQILTLWVISCVPFNKALTTLCFTVFLCQEIGICEE